MNKLYVIFEEYGDGYTYWGETLRQVCTDDVTAVVNADGLCTQEALQAHLEFDMVVYEVYPDTDLDVAANKHEIWRFSRDYNKNKSK